MNVTLCKLTLIGALLATGQASAAPVTLETEHWWVSYDSDATVLLGTPELQGTSLVFRPGAQISAPADQQYHSDYLGFSVTLNFVAKPGYQIMGYDINANGSTYVGDDARLGVGGAFNREFYGASYYSGALSGDGTWQDSFGGASGEQVSISGSLYVETTNHYSYEQQVGENQIPVYAYNYFDILVGTTPIYDEEGNFIGEEPLYETQYLEYIAYYNYEPIYETFFQTSGGSISFDEMRIDVLGTVSAVPLPPGALLLGSGLFAALIATRRVRSRAPL